MSRPSAPMLARSRKFHGSHALVDIIVSSRTLVGNPPSLYPGWHLPNSKASPPSDRRRRSSNRRVWDSAWFVSAGERKAGGVGRGTQPVTTSRGDESRDVVYDLS